MASNRRTRTTSGDCFSSPQRTSTCRPTYDAAGGLTRYAVAARYPDDLGEIDEAEWAVAVATARAVVAWAEGVVEDLPGSA